ncbi:hypothetical protein DXC69_08470 [Paenibacillus polymyxa]|nr:hypothetical protein FGY93_13445 [Paenibacillus polymyxa]RGL37201.1 hypothetical protein DXC69_08470 [Paenibacillus polymyxa]RTZ35469.1 hypothetical protein EJ573_10225 [Paenibacillus polymyxa]
MPNRKLKPISRFFGEIGFVIWIEKDYNLEAMPMKYMGNDIHLSRISVRKRGNHVTGVNFTVDPDGSEV